MNTIIIDDNEKAALDLKNKLKKYSDIEVNGIAQNCFDGLTMAEKLRLDAIFLDVEMPETSGLDFLDRVPWVKEGKCKIVMFTAHDKYVIPAFRKKAFDVLLKPIDPKELDTVVARLKDPDFKQETVNDEPDKDANMILLWTNSADFRLVNKNDIGIIYHNAEQRCWEAVVANYSKPLRLKRSIKADTLTELGNQFIQVNQKYIINMNYLIEVIDNKCHFFPPFDDVDYVTVGRMFRKKLTERFLSL